MRAMIVLLAAGAALAGCSKGDVAATNTTAPAPVATSASPDSSFSPPTSMSRADYGSKIERRFRKLDKNQDGKLSESELPDGRGARMMKRFDTNGDGFIDASEWSKGMLARFDKQDVNHDGNLTSDERGKHGDGKRGGRRQAQADDEGDDGDNSF